MKQYPARIARPGWRYTEHVLFALGIMCAAFFVYVKLTAWASGREARQFETSNRIVHAAAGQSASSSGAVQLVAATGPNPGPVMGRLEIPALSLSVPILSDYESASLLKGVGHIPGTAMPGGLGTLGLAGHRDTYFRPLEKIKTNMEIRVGGYDGTYRYLVDSTEIVKPENVTVLDIRSRPELALITCYPFYYVGAAPLRFIVHAHLVSAIPDNAR